MEQSKEMSCLRIGRYDGGRWMEKEDVVVREKEFTIIVNHSEKYTVVCSPTNLEAMAAGFLLSEGIIKKGSVLEHIRTEEDRGTVYLDIAEAERGTADRAAPAQTPEDKNPSPGPTIDPGTVLKLAARLEQQSVVFRRTGGAHCAALTDQKDLWVTMEDVGRHNTLDKISGYCFLKGIPTKDKVIVFSGRVACEIVAKTVKMGCPILIARSAPTDRALALARESGLTVISFARGNSFNVYTGKERLEGS